MGAKPSKLKNVDKIVVVGAGTIGLATVYKASQIYPKLQKTITTYVKIQQFFVTSLLDVNKHYIKFVRECIFFNCYA